MRLDPKKLDCAKLAALLRRLRARAAKAAPKGQWIPDTAKTLEDGKLEDYDLVEFVTQSYEADLARHEDKRPVWDYAQDLAALIDEMERLKLRDAKTARVRVALKHWTLP